MPGNKRERLVKSALELFHQHGISQTSLADIAKHARIPIGNVYYYFKTKEELALSTIQVQRDMFKGLFAKLDEGLEDPRQRLMEAVKYFDHVREDYTKYGCPSCSIIMSGSVTDDPVAKAATELFLDFIAWAQKQFQQLGHEEEARPLAITLVSSIQGAVVVAKASADANIISGELARLIRWLHTVPNKKVRLGKVAVEPIP